jgi:hypothetical protein
MNDAAVHVTKIRNASASRKPGGRDVVTVIPNSPARHRPPGRRLHLGETTKCDGQTYHVGVGFYPSGKPCEVFITVVGKAGSAIEAHVQTQAILVSLLLQHGVELTTIMNSISGPVAHALGLVAKNSCPSADARDGQEQITRVCNSEVL